MSKSSSNLVKRVITGVVGGAALIALVLEGGIWGARFFALLLAVGMTFEYGGIVFHHSDKNEKRAVLVILSILLAVVQTFGLLPVFDTVVAGFLLLFLYFMFTVGRFSGTSYGTHVHELAYAVFGFVYLGVLPLYLVWISELTNGPQWLLLFLLIVWMGDTGGYFGGRFFGKRKLYPAVSPKKTWEGYFTGLALSLGVALAYRHFFFDAAPMPALIALTVIINALAQMGDLCESILKRAFDKKDSGTVLPGHGGFLDRFDGVVFTLPIMYICVTTLI